MAQRSGLGSAGGARRRGGLPGGLGKRFGLTGGRAAAAACVALVVVCGAVGFALQRGSSGVTIERGSTPAVEGSAADDGSAAAARQATEAGGEEKKDAAAGADAQDEAQVTGAVVHVDGAVASPGVYALLLQKPRVEDAVEAAGGLASDADTTSVNLAAPVADGTKVHIPRQGEQVQATAAAGASAGGGEASPVASAGGTEGAGGLVNINTADETQLQTLPGVGEATAKAIVEDRAKNGPFESPQDLMRVSGIGEKKFAKLEGSICV